MKTEQQAGYILDVIPKCMRVIRTEMRALAKADLSVPQFRVLVRLSRSESTNKEVAEWLGVSTPTMTRMVDVLIRRELVERNGNLKDRREIRLKLTQRGRTQYEKIRANVQAKMALKVATLSSQKQEQLQLGLKVLEELFA